MKSHGFYLVSTGLRLVKWAGIKFYRSEPRHVLDWALAVRYHGPNEAEESFPHDSQLAGIFFRKCFRCQRRIKIHGSQRVKTDTIQGRDSIRKMARIG